MARLLAVAPLALIPLLTLAGGLATAGSTIDLDRPGALAALEQENPAHYSKVRLILEGMSRNPGSDVPRWMRAGFDARDVSYAPIVLTSHPAKRRLSFTLDDTHYVAVIVLTGLRGEIVPLR